MIRCLISHTKDFYQIYVVVLIDETPFSIIFIIRCEFLDVLIYLLFLSINNVRQYSLLREKTMLYEAPIKLNGRLKNLGQWHTSKKNKEFNIIDYHITRSFNETSSSISIDINCKIIHFDSHKYVHLVSHHIIWNIIAIFSGVLHLN